MRPPTVARTVAQDESVRRVQAAHHALSEQQDRLRVRRHALHTRLAAQMNNRVVVPPEVASLTPADAHREMQEIDRELAALERQVDALQVEMVKADSDAQAMILASEMPEYRQLVAACDQAKIALDQAEAARQQFLVDLRRRGVFATPPIAKED